MAWLTIVTMLALTETAVFGLRVGAARGKYGVAAPATTGNDMFERHYRVHYNTLEMMVLFVPAAWAFGYYVSYLWAAGLGVVYIIGRIVYAVTYVRDPASRGPGVLLSVVPTWILIAGGLIGAVLHLL